MGIRTDRTRGCDRESFDAQRRAAAFITGISDFPALHFLLFHAGRPSVFHIEISFADLLCICYCSGMGIETSGGQMETRGRGNNDDHAGVEFGLGGASSVDLHDHHQDADAALVAVDGLSVST